MRNVARYGFGPGVRPPMQPVQSRPSTITGVLSGGGGWRHNHV